MVFANAVGTQLTYLENLKLPDFVQLEDFTLY
jgi:hypothetical protein